MGSRRPHDHFLARLVPAAGATLLAVALMASSALAAAGLQRSDNTPFRPSGLIKNAAWTSPAYPPPRNQWGDILPTIWADDGAQYTMINDGGTDTAPKQLWKQSVARITGTPPHIHFTPVGDPNHPAPASRAQIHLNHALYGGPLGPYYSDGLVEAKGIFYAPQLLDWNWNANQPFAGLAGMAYSTNRGQTWQFGNKPFPAPLGNLSWVIRGRGGVYPDGWVYAIDTEREFNASTLIMGRSRPEIADMVDPSRWQWASGWRGNRTSARRPDYSNSIAAARPILRWAGHITYPQMAYDPPIHQYLLTFTYAYGSVTPTMWRDGEELVILTSSHPWGPFRFVARQPWFGPSNGYGAGFPPAWISRNGRDLWMKWAANFNGCAPHLRCSGGYGFNYRRLHLTLAGDRPPRRRK